MKKETALTNGVIEDLARIHRLRSKRNTVGNRKVTAYHRSVEAETAQALDELLAARKNFRIPLEGTVN
jgi:hypothetical protein